MKFGFKPKLDPKFYYVFVVHLVSLKIDDGKLSSFIGNIRFNGLYKNKFRV